MEQHILNKAGKEVIKDWKLSETLKKTSWWNIWRLMRWVGDMIGYKKNIQSLSDVTTGRCSPPLWQTELENNATLIIMSLIWRWKLDLAKKKLTETTSGSCGRSLWRRTELPWQSVSLLFTEAFSSRNIQLVTSTVQTPSSVTVHGCISAQGIMGNWQWAVGSNMWCQVDDRFSGKGLNYLG